MSTPLVQRSSFLRLQELWPLVSTTAMDNQYIYFASACTFLNIIEPVSKGRKASWGAASIHPLQLLNGQLSSLACLTGLFDLHVNVIFIVFSLTLLSLYWRLTQARKTTFLCLGQSLGLGTVKHIKNRIIAVC